MGVVGYTSCTAVQRTSGHCKQTARSVNTRVRPSMGCVGLGSGWVRHFCRTGGWVGSGLQILTFSKSLLQI